MAHDCHPIKKGGPALACLECRIALRAPQLPPALRRSLASIHVNAKRAMRLTKASKSSAAAADRHCWDARCLKGCCGAPASMASFVNDLERAPQHAPR